MSDLPPSPKRAKLDPPHATAAKPPLRTVELAGRVIAEHAEVATAESATDTNDSVRATDGKGKGVEVTVEEVWVTLKLSWARKELLIELCESDRVFDLKDKLYNLTSVPAERQKILGLVKGKLPPDESTIRDLKLTSGKKFTLVGTPIGQELKDLSEDDLPDVMNDLDVDISADPALQEAFINDRRNVRKIKEAVEKLDIQIMNAPREGKKLLVLDLDYTILDTKPLTSGSLPPAECARPGLHEFLTKIYPYYDICIWSQTSWIWLETKLVELEMVGSDKPYKISFVLDKTPMFTVFTTRSGQPFKHSVKALKIIWKKFPQYWGPQNTIHIDDLSRNFALNPGSGLKISAFKDAHTPRAAQDRELDRLGGYLVFIARMGGDFRELDHKAWKHTVKAIERATNAGDSSGATPHPPPPPPPSHAP